MGNVSIFQQARELVVNFTSCPVGIYMLEAESGKNLFWVLQFPGRFVTSFKGSMAILKNDDIHRIFK
jgi:hypothetical protein